MNVLVLGAGVIGTSCAYYLSRSGHQVTVLDRRSGAGLETSFGNAGGVCPSFAGPWASPGLPLKALKWMMQRHAPLTFAPTLDPHQWRWLVAFLGNCTAARFVRNKARMQRIAHYSKACLVELREATGIGYDDGQGGVLQIFQTEEEVDGGRRSSRVLDSFEVPNRVVTADEATSIEPALANATVTIAGGLHLPGDETGDCHLFTRRLTDLLRQRGVDFQFNTTVQRLLVEGGRIDGVATDHGVVRADIVVVALASEAVFLLRPVGIDLSVYPVKGYALTVPIDDGAMAPRSSVMDEHTKLMVTRLGGRLRAAGIAEVRGYDTAIEPAKCETVRKSVTDLFPHAADYSRAEYWAGLRPMTPDGPPYLGRTPVENLILSLGQGSNGWTQACGCGQIIADIVSGRAPAIDLDGYGLER